MALHDFDVVKSVKVGRSNRPKRSVRKSSNRSGRKMSGHKRGKR